MVVALGTADPVSYMSNTVELTWMAKAKGASPEGVRTEKLTRHLTGCSTWETAQHTHTHIHTAHLDWIAQWRWL